MIKNKTILLATVLVWLLALGFLIGPVRWEVSWIYSHWFGFSGLEAPVFDMDLPFVTRWFSLPLLGFAVANMGPWDSILFYVYWGCLFAYPLGLAIVILRVTEENLFPSAWVVGGSLYLVSVLFLSILAGFGLWAPFMHV
jgi:hypothetical protein